MPLLPIATISFSVITSTVRPVIHSRFVYRLTYRMYSIPSVRSLSYAHLTTHRTRCLAL